MNMFFINNLIASLNGCINPHRPTLIGPWRKWKRPKIFRSIMVKKAVDKRMNKIIIK